MSPATTHTGLVQPSMLFAVEARRQLESGDARQAIETCKRGLARYPEHAAGYVILAAAYRAIGQDQRAQLVLSRGYARTGVAPLAAQIVPSPDDAADAPAREAAATPSAREAAPAAEVRGDGAAGAIETPAPVSTLVADDAPVVADDATKAALVDTAAGHPLPSTPPEPEPDVLDAATTGGAEANVAVSVAEATADPSHTEAAEPEDAAATVEPRETDATAEPDEAEATAEPTELAVHVDRDTSGVDQSATGDSATGRLRIHERGAVRQLPAWFQRRARRDEPARSSNLALHSALGAHRVRSANPRLIPGLELSPLRHEEVNGRAPAPPVVEPPLPDWTLRNRPIVAAPPREMRGEIRNHASVIAETLTPPPGTDAPATEAEASAVGEAAASAIEELARRLEGARIQPVAESVGHGRHSFEPSIVSDTLAEILVTQGAYAEALKAFQTLARMRPERVEYYEAQIARMRRLIAGRPDVA